MSILNILRYPDPRLHTVAKPVTVFDERLQTLIDDMAETMYDAPGVGLAASTSQTVRRAASQSAIQRHDMKRLASGSAA